MIKRIVVSLGALALALAPAAPASAQTYSNAVMALKPAAYWPLNETTAPSPSGEYIATNSGTLGAAGNGYYETWWTNDSTGVLTNMNSIVHVPGAIAGDSDTALQQGGIAQYVVIPRATNGVVNSAVTLNPPFSIEFWFYPTNAAAGKLKPILAEGFNNVQETNLNYNTTMNGTALGMYSGFLYFNTFNAAGTKTEIDTGTLVLNQWHHVVATFDGTTESLYLDGALVKSKSPPVDALGNRYAVDNVSPLIIGGGNELGLSGGANVFFGGALDEVAIYNTALTSDQVTNHFETGTNATPTTPYTQVVSADAPSIYLRLDEPAFTGVSATNDPVAANVGALGTAANGYYLPGSTPGIPGPGYSGFGPGSSAVAFNGFNSAVDVGAGALPQELNPTNGQPMTVTTWFKGNPADCVGRFQVMVGHTDSSWRLTLDTAAGPRFNPGNGKELQFANVQAQLADGLYVNDGGWHFLAGVSDGTNESLYVDGMLVQTNGPAGIVTNGSMKDVILGGDAQYLAPAASGGGRWFDGSLAQVAFFTNALSSADIQGLYSIAGVPLTIPIQPQSITNNAGTAATVTASVHGSAPFYQWYSTNINSGVVTLLNGQTNASLVFNPATTNDSGFYFVIATNSVNAVTSSVAGVTIVGAPVVLRQTPSDVHVFVGTTPTLHLSVLGDSPAYQWLSNNAAIPNATNASYTLTSSDTSTAGGFTYACAVTNGFGAITDSFSVAVLPDPTAPYPSAVLASAPIDYFRLNESPDNGAGNDGTTAYDSAGANNAVYTNALIGQPGYSPVSDPGGLAAEFGDFPPNNDYAGNVPPYLNFGTPNGSNAEFSVEAWFTEYLYQNGGNCIVAIGYGNGGEQFVLDTGAGSTGALRFFVRNAAGTVSSASSSYVPNNDGLWHHAVGVCDEAGGHVYLYMDGKLLATANITAGSGILSSSMPLSIGARESGNSTPPNYDFQFIGAIDEVALYNRALSASEIANHYYASGIGPVLTQISPYNITTNLGSSVTFTVTAAGTQPLFYQWYDPGSQPIANATNASLTLTNVQLADQGQYTVTVTNLYNTASTNTSLIINQGPPVITGDLTPTNLVVFAGSQVTYTVAASGTPPFSYQWYLNGAAVSGATNSSYTFSALLGTNTYYVSITNSQSAGSPTLSSTATVVGMPSVSLNPADFTDHLKITLSGYNRGETLRDFPVLVKLSTSIPGFNYAHFASATGGDLRFTDAGGTHVIPHEIDQWNPNGESLIWVQIPSLSGTNDTIYAYWGNPADTTAPAGTNVWVPQPWEGVPAFAAVYHLKEGGFPFADSTGQNPANTGGATVQTNGFIGLGQAFNGSSYLDAGTINLSNGFTVSAWVNLYSTDTSIQTVWANSIGGYSSSGFRLYVNSWNSNPGDGAVLLETGNGSTGQQINSSAGAVPAGQWHLVSAVIDPSAGQSRLFVDGAMVASGATRNDMATNSDMHLGNFLDGAFPFNGKMDEARVREGTNSVNWLWASYMTVAQNSSLESYGSVSSTAPGEVDIQFQHSGNNLILTGSGGQQGAQYRLLSTTNVALPIAQWTPVSTNTFDTSGNFSNGIPVDSTMKGQFFRVVSP